MYSSPFKIIEMLEACIMDSIKAINPSKHYYDFDKNDNAKNAYIFAVRPGSASSVSGVIRAVTIEQDFEIELSKEFIEKGATDKAIREAIDSIYQDNEEILKKVYLNKSISGIIKISDPSYSEPRINQAQKSVSIIFTYPITYRKNIGEV